MRYIFMLYLILLMGCEGKKKYHTQASDALVDTTTVIGALTKHRLELNESFRNPETSPLPDRYRKNFEGLDFFALDTNFRIQAKLIRTPNTTPFAMPTTTDRTDLERVYGIAHFSIRDSSYQLEIYQSPDFETSEGLEDYLFLPFLDDTNGTSTYVGGRYIDLKIPDGDRIVIDFNKAYNPYCVYNKKYSCPLVPRVNSLPLKISAGVKMFDPNKKL